MKYDLSEFEKLVDSGHIRKVETADLVLYNYTDKTTYDRHWNEYTMAARGIIFEKSTGKLIAKPFPKFFNLGEMPETQLLNLPDQPYTVAEKLDGSLGIIYHYGNEWHVATRGSFSSTQAVKGLGMLTKYKMRMIPTNWTLLVEIIYPDNKIVVDYGSAEELVLLGVYNSERQEEYQIALSGITGMRDASKYDYTIEEMAALQAILPKDQEGFVVRFDNGLRVKIKGKEYMRIAKMISTMSPLSFWESMVDGVVNKDYLIQLPEEFRPDFEPIIAELEEQYVTVLEEIEADINRLPPSWGSFDKAYLKTVGLITQRADCPLKHPGAVFPYLLGKKEALNHYILKYIRPVGNNIKIL